MFLKGEGTKSDPDFGDPIKAICSFDGEKASGLCETQTVVEAFQQKTFISWGELKETQCKIK